MREKFWELLNSFSGKCSITMRIFLYKHNSPNENFNLESCLVPGQKEKAQSTPWQCTANAWGGRWQAQVQIPTLHFSLPKNLDTVLVLFQWGILKSQDAFQDGRNFFCPGPHLQLLHLNYSWCLSGCFQIHQRVYRVWEWCPIFLPSASWKAWWGNISVISCNIFDR